MAVHVQHRQTMLILQHEKNFMDDYIRHFAQSDTGNGTIQYSFLRFRLLSGGKCAGGHQGQGNSFRQYRFRERCIGKHRQIRGSRRCAKADGG